MRFAPGTRVGPYEITGAIGAGGMGEVYRARDTILARDVALKVLPDPFLSDVERMARFEREAKTLASLNHPNIAAIFGFEQSGPIRALVMELVPGEDLSARLKKGALPVSEALPLAVQMAVALGAAHDQGVIHRDLKPANVKITPDGTVKVLDFGLAKALDSPGSSDDADQPTITSPMTRPGVVLGTAAYMAPEQAKGRPIDRRADVWAFGCVLYEMLTGRRAFGGEDVTETIAAIVRDEPDWRLLPPDLPPVAAAFLRRCFLKSPRDRLQDIGDMRLALAGAFDPPGRAAVPPFDATPSKRLSPVSAAIAAMLAVAGGAAGWLLKPEPLATVAQMRQFALAAPPARFAIGNNNRALAMTPDGTRLIYFAGLLGERTMYVQPLDAVDPISLRKAERYFEPFLSPDSKWIGFMDESDFTLRKIPITGGPPIAIASIGREIAGATWAADGTIVFAYTGLGSGLMRIPPNGSPAALTTLGAGEASHGWPEYLPGGAALIYTVRVGERGAQSQIWLLDIATGQRRKLIENGSSPRYSAGHILYGAENAIWAVAFDATTLQIRGDPVQLRSSVSIKPSGGADFAVSADGSLAYVSASPRARLRRLVWVDRRTNDRVPANLPARAYANLRLSPDGSRVALEIREDEIDIWIWDLARDLLTKMTHDPAGDTQPVWSDDNRVVFSSVRHGLPNLYVQSADGTGTAERLTDSTGSPYAGSVTRDGSVLFWVIGVSTRLDLGLLPINSPNRTPTMLLQSSADERNPEISPDQKWLAYSSNENDSAMQEIYVRPYPGLMAGKTQISSGGGRFPAWSPGSGSELFYVRPDGALVAVPIRDGRPSGPARAVVSGQFVGAIHRSYDISKDGRRILVLEEAGDAEKPTNPFNIVLVLNWAAELTARSQAR